MGSEESAAGVDRPISAAVLAGGLSRRMGQDKALLSLRPGDPPLAEVVIGRVRQVADDVFVVASDRPAYERFGVPVVPDTRAGAGVLGAIATALINAVHEHCLVVACDLPFLNPALLRWMVEQPRDYDVLLPRIPGSSKQGANFVYQTLHGIYGKGCLPAIEQRMADQNLQVIGFFAAVRVRSFGTETVSRFDPDGLSFFNANAPDAADEAVRILNRADDRGRT